ncbi:MAG TPA: ABC transporter permease [Chloroflexota bacterium]|nr:ABC transporter permease [Chloroflexota bacterium]
MSSVSPGTEITTAPLPRRTWRERQPGWLRLAWFLLRHTPFACVVVVLFVLGAAFGSALAPHSQIDVNLLDRLQGPNGAYLLGTDEYGRDLLSRILGALRAAAEASLIVLLIGGVVGTTLGLLAGGLGGVVDLVLVRLTEIVQGFPVILLALVIVAITSPSLAHGMIAVGVGSAPEFMRIARGLAIQLRARAFVEAARGMGAGELYILRRELLPNMVGTLSVLASFHAAQAIMYEATLSFLGLGVQAPDPSFGGMLSEAKSYLSTDPSYAIVVGVPLAVIILALNLLGDALSDYFDPRRTR